MYGEIQSAWALSKTDLTLDVTVPPNTTATLVLPWATGLVTEDGNNIYTIPQISDIQKAGNTLQLTIGSGSYKFAYTYKPTIPVVKR